ncbi:DUF5666 domain-containing protein [Ideonella sp. A 288]|uniref:DUF5666 domain-containing protein n=1 Tax=Ideonella sp. A 288 TaxID=1962181 RepID=UPI00118607B5|nr:DUF5666 domain-containing protein [Ideonella sp. A 288]
MNRSPNEPRETSDRPGSRRDTVWIRWGTALGAAVLALVAACGGGGGDATSGTPATSTDAATGVATASGATVYTQGAIGGFGSVFVNGVRFDDSASQVFDDRQQRQDASVLRLGMQVEVESSAVDSATGMARALVIRHGSSLLGPVAAVNTSAGTFATLGQTVKVTGTTVFDDGLSGGLAALAVGQVVEVHGLADAATGVITATRVEGKGAATAYKLRGTVASLDTTAKTFAIGGAVIAYGTLPASSVPSTLVNGSVLRVQLQTAQSNGQWVATSLGVGGPRPVDKARGHVRGLITAFTSTHAFSLNGIAVDASGATFEDGTAGVVLGAFVEVKGTIVGNVLVATEVEVESRRQSEDSRRIELHGMITAVDAVANTFTVRNTRVSWAGTVNWKRGSAADLVVGRRIEVKGRLAADGTTVAATTIELGS